MSSMAAQIPTVRATKPRLGFLGVGWIGQHRLSAIANGELADIRAVADATDVIARQAAQLAAGAEQVGGLDELLSMDLDGLVIATPSAQHAQQAIAALDRGMAVFCQKPLGRNADEVRSVVAAAERADRLLGVDLSYRSIPGMQRIRDLIAGGELGHIYAVNLVFHNAYGPDKPWFYQRSASGGGCLLDLGIHLLDLALWTLEWPRLERATGRLFTAGRATDIKRDEVEDYAAAQLDLSSGAVVQLACSWRLSAGCDAVIAAEFYGTKGAAVLRNVNGSFFDFEALQFEGTQRRPLSSTGDEWFGKAAVEWTKALSKSRAFNPNAHQFTHVAEALDAIYAAGASA
jgi:predicted dehydrogenase